MTTKVGYEVLAGSSRASRARLMDALLECDAELRSHYQMSSDGDIVAIVMMQPERADAFRTRVRP